MPSNKKQTGPDDKKVKRGDALHNPKKSPEPKSPSKAGGNSDNPKIQQLIQARKENDKQKKAHRKFLTAMIVRAYSIGLELMEDRDAWLAFCALDWGKLTAPKSSQYDQAVRFALKFIFAKGKKGEKRASFYYSAIKDLAQKGLEPTKLAKAISDAGGLKKLQQKNTRKPGAKPDRVAQNDKVSEKIDNRSVAKPGNQRSENSQADRAQALDSEKPPTTKDAVGMTFEVIFRKTPNDLMSARLPAQIVLRGKMESFGKNSVLKVESYKVKKPKS